MLKYTFSITMRLGMLLNQESLVKACDLPALLKLFDHKSTLNKDKSVYQVVMKQYLRLNKLSWLELPDELVVDMVI
jgi:hypothetical protein